MLYSLQYCLPTNIANNKFEAEGLCINLWSTSEYSPNALASFVGTLALLKCRDLLSKFKPEVFAV